MRKTLLAAVTAATVLGAAIPAIAQERDFETAQNTNCSSSSPLSSVPSSSGSSLHPVPASSNSSLSSVPSGSDLSSTSLMSSGSSKPIIEGWREGLCIDSLNPVKMLDAELNAYKDMSSGNIHEMSRGSSQVTALGMVWFLLVTLFGQTAQLIMKNLR